MTESARGPEAPEGGAGSGGGGGTPPPPPEPEEKGGGADGPDPDAWMVTFSDLLTLLMTFFVLIFASQDPVKEKLQEAFGQQTGVFGLFRRSFVEDVTAIPRTEISQERLQALLDEVGATDVDVEQEERGIVVTLPSDAYFDPGSARLTQRAVARVTALTQYLQYSDHRIRVEGHTDNREVSSPTYPSSWELSLARAHSVLDVFLSRQIAPDRMSLVGYGPSQPRHDNISRVGRARNRRVEIVITGRIESP
jgi:chemotaxis protein MotB